MVLKQPSDIVFRTFQVIFVRYYEYILSRYYNHFLGIRYLVSVRVTLG